jgi:hypothetical protein
MLSNQHFYHRTVRKLVVSFGNIFNNLKMYRYASDGTTEVERLTVPLAYASKEKYYKRITEDPELTKQTQIILPRMAFEMAGLTYDPLRKIASQIDSFSSGTSASTAKKVKMTPYNFDFNLYIFVRNTEDGMQIVEQILPYFNPDYTLSVDFAGLDNLKTDVPVVFNNITYDDTYEGDAESTRTLIWTLNFTVKAYLFGPITDVKLITKSTANVMNNAYASNPLRQITFWPNDDNDLNYKIDEMVYQGSSFASATAKAFVYNWNASNGSIILYDTNGELKVNTYLTGAVTGARYNVRSFGINTNQLVNITVTPNPLSANANDAYGFSTNITEY